MGEEKKGESRWVRALRSIKCSETLRGKERAGREDLADCEGVPRGLLLRVNSALTYLPIPMPIKVNNTIKDGNI